MKRLSCLPLIALSLALVSCGTSSDHFKIDGRFLNLNQGEFYVYSTDGGTYGIDTIKVVGGRFTYERPCTRPATLTVVFPNFSEQPIFAEPGKSVSVEADASHLKEMKVKGTKANELMTEFRKMTANSSPPETKKLVCLFIEDHPDSPVSVYLLTKHLVQTRQPDYQKAMTLIARMQKEQPSNGTLARLAKTVGALAKANNGGRLPQFSATDVKGNRVSDADVKTGTCVISVWASWSYESTKMQRMLHRLQKQKSGRLKVVSICLDGNPKDCQRSMERDSITWPNICDGMLFEGNALRQTGLGTVPDNMLVRDGRVIARSLSMEELENKLKNI